MIPPRFIVVIQHNSSDGLIPATDADGWLMKVFSNREAAREYAADNAMARAAGAWVFDVDEGEFV